MMKIYLLLIINLLLIPLCMADFNDGVAAYNRGDYQAALKEWQAIANQPIITNSFEWHSNLTLHTADAQYALALLYWQGKGVKQNYKTAEKWLIPAATSGHSEAQLKLAYLYMMGLTKAADYNTARQWLESSAYQGNSNAHYNLALLYFKGLGVKQDNGIAKAWLALPIKQGDKAALELMTEIDAPATSSPNPSANKTVESIVIDSIKTPELIAKPITTEKSVTTTAAADYYYTIQLIAVPQQQAIIDLMRQWHSILNPMITFEKTKNNKPIFVLAYGTYTTAAEARKALVTLPKTLKRHKPWVVKIVAEQRVQILD